MTAIAAPPQVAPRRPDAVPGMTVIVPTLNRGGFLLATLRDLLAQDHRPLEILVVDQGDATDPALMDLCSQHADVITYHHVPFRGLPQARNFGWQQARYDSLLYVDDDIRCGPMLVTEHLKALSRDGVGMVGGGIDEAHQSPVSANAPAVYDRWSATPKGGFSAREEHAVEHVKGCNYSIRRTAMMDASGVDEALSVGAALYEETDLALRVVAFGHRVRFCGAARLQHLAAPSGGCRTNEVAAYVLALAHNRTILIRRHSRPYQRPVALAHLAATAVAFAWHYRRPSCLSSALRGAISGWRAGGRAPICTPSGQAGEARA